MRLRHLGSFALTAWLLLAQTAGAAAHVHGLETQLHSLACSVDHGGAPSRAAPQGPVAYAGDEHVHDCLGCHLGGKRLRTVLAWRPADTLTLLAEPVTERNKRVVSTWLDRHRSPRGPPSA